MGVAALAYALYGVLLRLWACRWGRGNRCTRRSPSARCSCCRPSCWRRRRHSMPTTCLWCSTPACSVAVRAVPVDPGRASPGAEPRQHLPERDAGGHRGDRRHLPGRKAAPVPPGRRRHGAGRRDAGADAGGRAKARARRRSRIRPCANRPETERRAAAVARRQGFRPTIDGFTVSYPIRAHGPIRLHHELRRQDRAAEAADPARYLPFVFLAPRSACWA